MKHLFLVFFLILVAIDSAHSQKNAFTGKVAYISSVRYSLFIAGAADKTDTTYLYFNDSSSVYMVDVKRNLDTKKVAAQIGNVDPVVKEALLEKISAIYDKQKIDFDYHQNSTRAISRRWLSPDATSYCITDTLADFNWTLFPDTLRVLGFLCQKAVSKSIWIGGLFREFAVWFTPEIPVPYGPKNIFGLPGLVLMADSKYYQYKAVHVKIPLSKDEMVKIDPCRGLPVITKKQADEINLKTRTDMMNMQKLRGN